MLVLNHYIARMYGVTDWTPSTRHALSNCDKDGCSGDKVVAAIKLVAGKV